MFIAYNEAEIRKKMEHRWQKSELEKEKKKGKVRKRASPKASSGRVFHVI